jgi:hypothetical protein
MRSIPALQRAALVSGLLPWVISSCGVMSAAQSRSVQSSAKPAQAAAPDSKRQFVTVPAELIGVWSSDDADGRAQCNRYRALPADIGESDEGWVSLVGSIVITPSLIHQYSEYGEGNFYAVRGIEALGGGNWRVAVQVGIDTMPTDEGQPDTNTYRLKLKQARLRWESEAPAGAYASAYFRCGDIRRDVYQVE